MGPVAQAIAERMEAVRERTLALFAPLDHERLHRSPDPIMSPPVWDLGHIAAYEELWLVERLTGRASLYPGLQAAYDAFETPRAVRGDVELLDAPGALDYLTRVRERSLESLAAADLDPEGPELLAGGFVFELALAHEAQHTETVLQSVQMMPSGAYRPPARREVPESVACPKARIEIAGGQFWMGSGPAGFAYDCERPRHRRELRPFAIDRAPVTNGCHLAFIADGGYRRDELWSEEGWAWRCAEGVTAPLYWARDGEGGWLVRAFDEWQPVDPERPVCHVSWYEADAYARWAGGRLPTEAEWERAATADPTGGVQARYPWGDADPAGRANLDQLAFGTAPAGAYPEGAAPSGCLQLVGDVWEWTASRFAGYEGFRAFPYREYAEPFFGDGYRVLRGGSWATQPHAAGTTFRNWDLPRRRQIFAGFRCAWDLPDGG